MFGGTAGLTGVVAWSFTPLFSSHHKTRPDVVVYGTGDWSRADCEAGASEAMAAPAGHHHVFRDEGRGGPAGKYSPLTG